MGCAFANPSSRRVSCVEIENNNLENQLIILSLVHSPQGTCQVNLKDSETEDLNTANKSSSYQKELPILLEETDQEQIKKVTISSKDTTASTKMTEANAIAQSNSGSKLKRSPSGHLVPQPADSWDVGEGFVGVHELYNLLNDGQRMPYLHDPTYMLILDVREREVFNETHITTARHCNAVDTEFDCLLSQGKLEKFAMVVVYDQSSTSGKVEATLASFVQRLEEKRISPLILSGGFVLFQQTYPFLCNNLTIRSEQDRMRLFKSYPSVILEGILYQGNVKHSQDNSILQNLWITHILNVSMECKNAFPDDFQYEQVKVEDETSAQLGPKLQSAANFVEKAIANGGRVFVHCVQGKSRSSTCTIAYLMSTKGWTLKDAHDYLKERRTVAAPNRGFLNQLSKFEESLFGSVLSSVDDLYF